MLLLSVWNSYICFTVHYYWLHKYTRLWCLCIERLNLGLIPQWPNSQWAFLINVSATTLSRNKILFRKVYDRFPIKKLTYKVQLLVTIPGAWISCKLLKGTVPKGSFCMKIFFTHIWFSILHFDLINGWNFPMFWKLNL